MIADSAAVNEDYAKRAVELGHKVLSSVEHGWQGYYYETYELAKKYDLKFIFGAEAYWVKNRFDKDRVNNHIVLLAKNENGRQAINEILSEANETGYYFRPRVDLELLLSLPSDDVGHILLHRMIYTHKKGKIENNMQIDHINGDTLDNRITNLRQCTIQENARNSRKRPIIKNGGITGVRKDSRCNNSWRAQIYIDQTTHIEKTYQDRELAIIQRLIWELQYFGEYAPQIELIKSEYSYLLNYLSIKDTMRFTSDIERIKEIGDSLKENPHCPCMLKQNDNTLCPCLPCRTNQHCHCGMFEKI